MSSSFRPQMDALIGDLSAVLDERLGLDQKKLGARHGAQEAIESPAIETVVGEELAMKLPDRLPVALSERPEQAARSQRFRGGSLALHARDALLGRAHIAQTADK